MDFKELAVYSESNIKNEEIDIIKPTSNIGINKLLTKDKIEEIVIKWLKERNLEIHNWKVLRSEVKRACDGMSGFLGDHFKADLYLNKGVVRLFIKTIPINNKVKADFIREGEFYHREMMVYKIISDIDDENEESWNPKSYLCDENILVMPDLSVEGYMMMPAAMQQFDFDHANVALKAAAYLHATMLNYQTRKEKNQIINNPAEFDCIFEEGTFKDSPFLKTAVMVCAKILKQFTTKKELLVENLEEKMHNRYLEGIKDLRYYEETVNCVIHKDLWSNNILFKYENSVPVRAVLVDYQCARYGPPAFDVMTLLYLNTDEEFRRVHEKSLIKDYYDTFYNALTLESKTLVEKVRYDLDSLYSWCDRARMFSLILCSCILPFTLLDPKTSQYYFDDPVTFDYYVNFDRSEIIANYAKENEFFRKKNLDITEEFVMKFILKNMN